MVGTLGVDASTFPECHNTNTEDEYFKSIRFNDGPVSSLRILYNITFTWCFFILLRLFSAD